VRIRTTRPIRGQFPPATQFQDAIACPTIGIISATKVITEFAGNIPITTLNQNFNRCPPRLEIVISVRSTE
jgi:hypothetical protein